VPAYVVDGVLHMVSGSAWFGEARLGSGQGLGHGRLALGGILFLHWQAKGWAHLVVLVLCWCWTGLCWAVVVLEGAHLERVLPGVSSA